MTSNDLYEQMGENVSKRIRRSVVDQNAEEQKHQRLLSIVTHLHSSREDVKLENIVFQCKDGPAFAHKSVLITGSDYFRGMFSHGTIENDTNTVYFPDISCEAMNIIIKFIYAQDTPIQADTTDALIRETLIAAHKLQLDDLFDIYWVVYSSHITLDKLLDVWQLAEMFSQVETLQYIRTYVLTHSKLLSESEMLSDMTVLLLESLLTCSDYLTPHKIGDLIKFILIWGANTKNMDDASYLISKCDVAQLPNYFLQELVSPDQIAAKSPAIYNILSKEAVSRWLNLSETIQTVQIHFFEIVNESCKHSVSRLSQGGWMPRSKNVGVIELDELSRCFPAVSGSGQIFRFTLEETDFEFIATLVPETNSTRQYCFVLDELPTTLDDIIHETANRNEIIIRVSDCSFLCFNFTAKQWREIDFKDQIDDCKCLLLAAECGKYFFDVDERHIKIVDTTSGTCVTKEKLHGYWQSIKCRSLNVESPDKLIFFQKLPICSILVYDVEYDFWSIVVMPDIRGDVVMYAYYDCDCLIFEKTKLSYNVYSLKTMTKVTEYVVPKKFRGCVHIDLSVKTKFK